MQPWRIGVLFSKSGCTVVSEQTLLNGTLLAIEEVNAAGGIAGREVEPVIYDPASDPENYHDLAERLVNNDGVNVIFGGYTSASRKAMLPVIEQNNALLFYPTFYEGFEFSENVFYTGACPNQYSVWLTDYLLKNYGKRFYLVGSNYIFPYESHRIVFDLVTESGGTILNEKYHSLNASEQEISKTIEDIAKNKPDIIFSILVGQSIISFYEAYNRIGLDPTELPIASVVTSEAEIEQMGYSVASGHIGAATYFESIDSKANNLFTKNYREKFGQHQRTSMCCEAAYFQFHLFAKALAHTNSLDTAILRSAIPEIEINAPQGTIRIDSETHHAYLWSRIAKINPHGDYKIIAQSNKPIKPDPYLVDHSRQNLEMGLRLANHQ